MKLEFSRHVFENSQNSNLMKICPVVAELFQANGQTDKQSDSLDEAVVFAIFRTPIINPYRIKIQFVPRREHFVFMLEKTDEWCLGK